MAEKITVEDATRSDLPPLNVEEEEIGGLQGGENAEPPEFTQATQEEVANLLRLGYSTGAWVTKYGDIWAVSDEEVNDIASRLVIKVNQNKYMAMAVKTVDLESVWLMLFYSFGSRILMSIRRKKEEKMALEEEQENAER